MINNEYFEAIFPTYLDIPMTDTASFVQKFQAEGDFLCYGRNYEEILTSNILM
jgi:hypothetical protein